MRGFAAGVLGGVLLAGVGAANAAELAGWSLNGFIDSSVAQSANRTSAGVSASRLSRSSGLGGLFVSDAFLLTGWPTGSSVNTARYMEFGVTVADGQELAFTTIAFSAYSDSGGNASWQIRASADQYMSVLASGTAVNVSGSGVAVAADISALGQRVGQTTFRLYFYNNTGLFNRDKRGLSGTNKGGIGLTVNGSVMDVAADPPHIDSIAIEDGVVRLDISELSPTGNTLVQRLDPFPATSWSDIETFANTAATMSWTSVIPAGVHHDLFRVKAMP